LSGLLRRRLHVTCVGVRREVLLRHTHLGVHPISKNIQTLPISDAS
jgi:hypothetical protein